MHITLNTTASLAYRIHAEKPDGELIEFFDPSTPKQMIFGYDQQIEGFEKGLMGRKTGPFSFEITPNDAFGMYQESLNIWVPKSAFMDQGELRTDLLVLGNKINMLDNRGNKINGTIKSIEADSVLMDFNHPLAGKHLYVSGEILSIRPVNQRDLASLQTQESCGCGSDCGCSSHNEAKDSCCSSPSNEEEGCEVCGNPPEKMGQGHGNCQCGN
jgi:FKBP-type peptidyl-prolyl cis-trans isomerase SlyD